MAAGNFWVENVRVAEGASGTQIMRFTVRRVGGTDVCSVAYSTRDKSARAADGDYVATAGVLQFAAGVESLTLDVAVNGDGKLEFDEAFDLVLFNLTNGAALLSDSEHRTPGVGAGVILNDDARSAPGMVWVNDASIAEGMTGTRQMVFTVTRTGTVAFDVDFATTSFYQAATPGVDFVATTGKLHFGEGVTSQTVSVTILSDTNLEPNESFGLSLSNPTAGMAFPDRAVSAGYGTILDDDAGASASFVSVNDVILLEGSSGTRQATFTVTRTGGSDPFTVDYGAFDYPGNDIVRQNGTLSFAAGENTKTVTVQVLGDTVREPDETFTVQLANARGAQILKPYGVGTILNDDPIVGAGAVIVSSPTVVEGNGGTRTMVFTVQRSDGSDAFSLRYWTGDSNSPPATAGTDYVATSGYLSFGVGENTKTIAVTINGDSLVEQDETVGLWISDLTNGAQFYSNYGAGPFLFQGRILNDDGQSGAGAVWVENAVVVEGGSGLTQMTFTVRRSGGSAAFFGQLLDS